MLEVSVITPSHNSAATIERNIRSVAAQSCPALEHIIIDDGSTDTTLAAIERLQDEFSHVVLIRQSNRGGAAAARNAGIEAARARYVAFLDSDDYWTDRKLEAQIDYMTAERVAFSYGDYELVDAHTGRRLGRHESPRSISYAELLRGCPIGCLTVAYDQIALGKHYMPNVQRGQDWGLWLRLTRSGAVARRYPGCHGVYTRAQGSLSSGKVRKVADIYRIYRGQERLSRLKSLRYLTQHVLSSRRKSYRSAERR